RGGSGEISHAYYYYYMAATWRLRLRLTRSQRTWHSFPESEAMPTMSRILRSPAIRIGALLTTFLLLFLLGLAPQLDAQTPAASEPRGAFEVTSLLGRKLYAQPDDAAVIAARKKLAADPKNVSLVLALSQAQAGRRQYREAVATCTRGLAFAPKNADLYIEKGHRELGLREFRAAERDLAHAASLDPTKLDAFYHLGLAHYFQGQFAAAAESFGKALALAKNNDSVIDFSNWLYVSLRRADKPTEAAEALKRITPEMQNTEPHLLFYLHLLRFYQGAISEKDVLPAK